MGWLRQLKESYWQSPQVDLLDDKLEPLRLGDTEAAQQSPVERFVEVERDLGRMTLVTQALIEACVRKGLLSHEEIAGIIKDVDLSQSADASWGAAATNRPSLPLALVGNGHAAGNSGGSAQVVDDFGDDAPWGNDDEPTEVEGGPATATSDDGFDFGGGDIDQSTAITVGEDSEGGVESIPRTAPFPKPKKKAQKSSSLPRQMIGMALSGMVGLAIAYFILLWFFKNDILQDYGVAQSLPGWMVPAQFQSSGGGAKAKVPLEQQFPDTEEKWGDLGDGGKSNAKPKKKKGSNVLTPKMNTPTPGSGGATGFGEGETFAGFGQEEEPTMLNEPGGTSDGALSGLDEPDLGVGIEEEVAKISPNLPGEDPLLGDEEEEAGTPKKDPTATVELTQEKNPSRFAIEGAGTVDGQTLGDTIKEANEAMIALGTGSLTDDATKASKISAYKKFCALAQALTFVGGDPEKGQLETRIPAAEDVAKKAVAEENTFEDVATIGHQWIGVPAKSRGTDGVFLTGKVKDVQSAGQLKAVTLDMGKNREATVIVSFETDVVITDRVSVLGVIVENPLQKLAGYEATEVPEEASEGVEKKKPRPVVWSNHIMMAENPLPAFE